MIIDDETNDHWSHKAHGVTWSSTMIKPYKHPTIINCTQSIDDPHESSRKVVGNVQHGALFPGVDEAIAAHGNREEDHSRGGVVPSEGGSWEGVTQY